MNFAEAQEKLSHTGRNLHARGWVPATSGNFSLRLDDGDIAITASGKDKAELRPGDIMRIASDGSPKEERRPSAETALHTQLYRHDKNVGCVLHTHSVLATLVSQQRPDDLVFANLEILKAFSGIDTHDTSVRIPVFANSQDIDALADAVEAHMQANSMGVGYLIAGHGLYTWARSLPDCLRHLEALEFLFDYYWRSMGQSFG